MIWAENGFHPRPNREQACPESCTKRSNHVRNSARKTAAASGLRRRVERARRLGVHAISTSSISSASTRTMPPPTPPGRQRRSRPSTMRICAISSSTCTACSTPRARAGRRADIPCRCRRSNASAIRRPSRTPPAPCGVVSAPGLAHQPAHPRAGRHLRHDVELPVIVAMWHGQHFMTPFIKRDEEATASRR